MAAARLRNKAPKMSSTFFGATKVSADIRAMGFENHQNSATKKYCTFWNNHF